MPHIHWGCLPMPVFLKYSSFTLGAHSLAPSASPSLGSVYPQPVTIPVIPSKALRAVLCGSELPREEKGGFTPQAGTNSRTLNALP